MICEYVHLPQDEHFGFEERGYYVDEGVMEFNGRKLLYLVMESDLMSFCFFRRERRLTTIDVEGYVVRWKYRANENGSSVSQIEPVRDEEEQREIKETLQSKHAVSGINFL